MRRNVFTVVALALVSGYVAGGQAPAGQARQVVDAAAEALGGEPAVLLRAMAGGDTGRAEAAIERLCAPVYARAARALLRDTVSPNVIHAGVKYNVIPGEAIIEVDCRLLPGTEEPAMRADIEARLGPELLAVCRIEDRKSVV